MHERLPGTKEHIEAAQEKAVQIDDISKGTPLKPIARVAVLGEGKVIGGLSMDFFTAGSLVTIVEAEQANLDRAVVPIRILAGVEVMHMIRKRLMKTENGAHPHAAEHWCSMFM